jgi:hypothetical protein
MYVAKNSNVKGMGTFSRPKSFQPFIRQLWYTLQAQGATIPAGCTPSKFHYHGWDFHKMSVDDAVSYVRNRATKHGENPIVIEAQTWAVFRSDSVAGWNRKRLAEIATALIVLTHGEALPLIKI